MLIQELIAQEEEPLKSQLTELFSKFPRMSHISLDIYKRGDTLIEEGTPCQKVFLMISGYATASWNEPGISQYNAKRQTPLTFIGDLAVLGERENYTTSMHVVRRSRIITISRATFEKWMEEDPKLYRKLVVYNLHMLQEQARVTRRTVMESSELRILEYLHKEFVTSRLGRGDFVKIKDKREQITESVGAISLRSLNRYISRLKQQNLISIDRGKITVSSSQDEEIQKLLKEATGRED